VLEGGYRSVATEERERERESKNEVLVATKYQLVRERDMYIFQDHAIAPSVPAWLIANRVREDVQLWTKYC
jgi:hypothetical protein